jgi:hypothetical protein
MPDLIAHSIDVDELRELAPRIPVSLVESGRFFGNVDELLERFGEF